MKLSDAVNVYVDRLRLDPSRSTHTIRSRASDLRKFMRHHRDTLLRSVSSSMIQTYFGKLIHEEHFAPVTVLRHWSTLKSFFHFCIGEGTIDRSPLSGIHLPVKAELQPPVVLSKGEIRRMLMAPEKEIEKLKKELARRLHAGSKTEEVEKNLRESIRNRAVIELLFATGMRVGELVNLKVKDFNFHNNTVMIRLKKGAERLGYFPSDVVKSALREYLEQRKKLEFSSQTFYLNSRGDALQQESVRKIVRKYADSAKIGKTVTPYTLRHSLVSLLLEAGTDIYAIQQIIGTSSNLMIQLVARNKKQSLKSALEKADPRKT
ncbi:tyrosine-type recombinase/integrase [candidate division KSB1 bacterium]